MQITVNGKQAESTDSINVTQLLEEQKAWSVQYVSVELNGEILDRGDFDSTIVSDGDAVEFLYFMGGGSE